MATVAASALGIGALHLPVLAGCACLALGSAYFALHESAGSWPRYGPALVPLALAAFTVLQALPLPFRLLEVIAPHNAQVWAYALQPFGEGSPAWASVSLDPGASLVEALKWTTYAAVLVASVALGRARGAAWGASAAFLVAVAVAAVTFGHGVIGATKIYGVYAPTFHPARWNVGPLLNPNNLSGYLNVGLLCGAGCMMSRRPPFPRVALGLGVATLLGVVFVSASRAGLVAAFAGLLLLAALVRWIGRGDDSVGSGRLLLGMLAVVVGAMTLAWLGATPETVHALLDKNVEKLEVITRTAPLLVDYAWLGVGRGAFESVFPAYHVSHENVIYAHPENFVVQWVAEWGFPVGIGALVLVAWALQPRRLRADRSVTSAGVWAGLMALALQNLLDLALEVPGVAVMATFCIGVVWGDAHRERTDEDGDGAAERSRNASGPSRSWETGWVASGVAILATGLLVSCFVFGRRSVARDRWIVRDLVSSADFSDASSVEGLRRELRASMLRHPGEPYFPRVGALVAWRVRDQSSMPWIARALDRGPQIGATHLALARILASAKARNQALFELRLTATYQPDLVRRVAPLTNLMARDFEEVLRAVPDGDAGARLLMAIASGRHSEGYADIRESCLAEVISRSPDLLSARSMFARDLIQALSGEVAPSKCDGQLRATCIDEVKRQIAEIGRRSPDVSAATLLVAELWMAIGRAGDAAVMLGDACPKFPGNQREACMNLRLRAALKVGTLSLVREVAKDIAERGCVAGTSCGNLFQALGRDLEHIGDWGTALTYYQGAVSEDSSDAHWSDVARAANAIGNRNLAAEALSRIANRHPTDALYQDQLRQADRARLPALLGNIGR